MRKANIQKIDNPITVDTAGLQSLLGCGRATAVEIGKQAGAKITLGKRVLWSVQKVQAYTQNIATNE